MLDALLVVSFLAGLIPAVAFTTLYALRSRWQDTGTGRAMFALMVTIVVSYSIPVMTLMLPGALRSTSGTVIRIGIRFAVAAILWYLLVLLIRLQRKGYGR